MKTFVEIATEIGELVTEKNLAYGSSFARAGEFLALLYPAGLRPEQYGDALLLVRMFDKMMRIATDRDALGESPFLDLSGYGILGAHMHQQKEGRGECLENASGENAWSRSKAQRDSARPGAAPQTLPSDGAGIESGASPQHSSCCARSTSAPAASATEDASASAGDPQRKINFLINRLSICMRACNDAQLCAWCGEIIAGGSLRISLWRQVFIICGKCSPTEIGNILERWAGEMI